MGKCKKTAWEQLAELPFASDIVADLKSELTLTTLRNTQHATLMAEGRREYAVELLMRMGEL